MTYKSIAQNEAEIVPGDSDKMQTGVNVLLLATVLTVGSIAAGASFLFSSNKGVAPAAAASTEESATMTYSVDAKKCPPGSIRTEPAVSGETMVRIPKGCLPPSPNR